MGEQENFLKMTAKHQAGQDRARVEQRQAQQQPPSIDGEEPKPQPAQDLTIPSLNEVIVHNVNLEAENARLRRELAAAQLRIQELECSPI